MRAHHQSGGSSPSPPPSSPPASPAHSDLPCLRHAREHPLVNSLALRGLLEGWGAAGAKVAAELVQAFLSSVPQELENIARHFRTGDTEALRRAAHRLKGSSSQVGAARIAFLCATLEQCAQNRNPCPEAACLAELQDAFTLTQREFDLDLRALAEALQAPRASESVSPHS